MKRLSWIIIAIIFYIPTTPILAQSHSLRGVSGLAVSPDGQTLSFSCQGDIWTAPADGGLAQRLTIHPADDRTPVFSPDGNYLAFSSNRYGNMDVFIMETFGGEPRRLTYHSANDMVTQFAPSGDFILFNSYRDFQEYVIWKISVDGNEPEILCPTESVHGKLSPDETRFVFQRGGSERYRKGYRGPGAASIWLMNINTRETSRILSAPWNIFCPEWFPDGDAIACISEENDKQTIIKYFLETKEMKSIAAFSEGILSDMVISPDAKRIYFCLDSEVHYVDEDGTVRSVPIQAPADRTTSVEEYLDFSTCNNFVVSPDNKQIVVEYRGDLFAIAPEGGKTQILTQTPWRESNPCWHPKDNALYYLSDRNRKSQVYRLVPDDGNIELFHKARFFKETLVFEEDVPIRFLDISPDGKSLVYSCADGKLVYREINGTQSNVLLTDKDVYSLDFSADSRWITYVREFGGLHYETYLLNLETQQEHQVSLLYGHDSDTRFSKDGKQLLVVSSDFNSSHIYAVWLSKQDHEKYVDDDDDENPVDMWDDDDDEEDESIKKTRNKSKTNTSKTSKKTDTLSTVATTIVDLEAIHERFRRLVNWMSDTESPLLSTDGKTLFFVSNALGKNRLFTLTIKGNYAENPKVLAEINPKKYTQSKDGASLFYMADSTLGKIDIATGIITPIPIKGRMRLDRVGEFLQMYNEAWSAIKYGFYDPEFHGVDWDAAYQKYLPSIEQARTAWEFNDVALRLIGELNASHLGIWGGYDPGLPSIETGRLGLRLGAYTDGLGYIVKETLPDTPANREESKILPGEYLYAINRAVLSPSEPMAKYLNDTIGKLIELEIVSSDAKPKRRRLSLKPLNYWEYESAGYKHWIVKNQQLVDSLSAGHIGYVHIREMGRRSLEKFRNDVFGLHWKKDALIIDVRGNPGGYIHNELLKHLTGERFGVSIPRLGEPEEHPNYVWRKPSVVVIDEKSFSDAEVFPSGYQTLDIGKVIGMPTFGGVIGTGGMHLLNGAWFRLPCVGWYTSDGRNMENTGAQPDILVERSPFEHLEGRDSQLERAVEELMAELSKSENSAID